MKKRMLLKLPMLELTEKMLQSALEAEPTGKIYYPVNGKRYTRNSYFRASVTDEILQIAVYFTEQIKAGQRLPAYRLFVDKEANDFITYDMNGCRWLTARLDNLKWPGYFSYDTPYIEPKEKACIETYCGIETFKNLHWYQQEIREMQKKAYYKKKTDDWDAIMKHIPVLPKDWENWLLKDGIPEHYMFYTYRRNGTTTGRCSRCGKEQLLIRPKYNQKGICKNCRRPITYKSIGKVGRFWTERYIVHLVQKMNGGVVTRQFCAFAIYQKDKWDRPELHYREERRMLLDQNKCAKAFYYGEYKDKSRRWIQTNVCDHQSSYYYDPRYFTKEGMVYRRTIPSLKKKELKESGLSMIVRTGVKIAPEIILLSEMKNPVIEKAAKANMVKLATDLINSTWKIQLDIDAGKLHKCLCIDREQLKRLRRWNGGTQYLEWLQHEKQYGKSIPDEVISWYLTERIKIQDISFIEDRMSPYQIMNYLLRQRKQNENESFSNLLHTWKDYLAMAKENELDVKDEIVYRASNLLKRHDEMVLQIAEKRNGQRVEKLLEQFPNLNDTLRAIRGKYEYQDQDYAILVPQHVQDVLCEGNVLQHCVDKTDHYFERISKGETYILFLRRCSDLSRPYYTLEVEPGGTIRQKRTKFNRQNEDIEAADEFLRKWQREIQKRLTKEDLHLAEKSKEMRQQQYQKLRDERVAIQQGTYEGKLLIDLLEADLMEMQDAA